MKQILAFLLSALMVLSLGGCYNENGADDLEIDAVARSYLKTLNVTDSYLTSIDYQAIDKYEIPERTLDYTYVSSSIDEILDVFYYFNSSDDEYVKKGSMILFNCKVKDEAGSCVYDKNGKILVGSGNLKLLEQKALSKRKGETIKITPNTELRDFFGIPKHTSMEIKILDIFDLTEKSDTKKSLSDNGFDSLLDFYNHLFGQKIGEYYFEETTKICSEFLDFATEHCEFNIAYEDLKNYTRQVVKNNADTAESFGLTVEEYYSDILGEEESVFFFNCSQSANREIKTALVIGALAKHNDIHIDSKKYQDFCSKNNVDLDDEISKSLIEYYLLQSEVIKFYTSAELITYGLINFE